MVIENRVFPLHQSYWTKHTGYKTKLYEILKRIKNEGAIFLLANAIPQCKDSDKLLVELLDCSRNVDLRKPVVINTETCNANCTCQPRKICLLVASECHIEIYCTLMVALKSMMKNILKFNVCNYDIV